MTTPNNGPKMKAIELTMFRALMIAVSFSGKLIAMMELEEVPIQDEPKPMKRRQIMQTKKKGHF